MPSHIRDILVSWDHSVWYYINTQWHNDVTDNIFPYLRNQWFWVPLYLFLAIFIPYNFGKKGLIWCAGFIVSFIFSDQVSATLMKPYFHRLRPCHNPALNDVIHLLVSCGGNNSFPSSHAANHFSIGIFTAVTLGMRARWIWPVSIIWALSVAYAQVYVGVHYPLDVLCGGAVGTVIGICTGKLFNKYVGLDKNPGALPTS